MLKIDLQKLRENALTYKRLTDRFLYAVVKADGYGHGGVAVASALYPVADGFAVALVREGIAIRTAACGKEILVLTPPLTEDDVVVAARNGLTLTAGDICSAQLIAETVKKYRLRICAQVKINTGMNRYGTYGATLGKVCKILKGAGQVCVQGVYSHLYSQDRELCEMQRMRFCRDLKIVRGYFPLARAHLAATYGVGLGETYYFDAVRIGLGLYGYSPVSRLSGGCSDKASDVGRLRGGGSGKGSDVGRLRRGGLDEVSAMGRLSNKDCSWTMPRGIQPVMKAYAPCLATRICRFGGAGYGGERVDLQGEALSVLRSGYADGLGVSGENCGLRLNVPSGICMDVCLAKGKRKRGEYALLFDDAAAVAHARGTSVYEILCLAGMRAQKIYYG